MCHYMQPRGFSSSLEPMEATLIISILCLVLALIALGASIYIVKKSLYKSQLELTEKIRSLASEALHGNTKEFLELASRQFEENQKSSGKSLDQREKLIQGMISPLKEQLDKYQQQVQAIERERQRSYQQVESELKRVVESNLNLGQQTMALKDALKKPHVRGRWGEMQLKNCVDLAGMSEFSDVTFQDYQNLEDGGRLIPDMTVKMPGGRVVVVDAKTPIDAFIASLEAKTDSEREAEMLRHGRHVREHIQKLSTRAYNEALSDSPDFTVMFLPNESFLYAALETQADIVEYALEKKILIATPPTLIGLLKVIRFGWNEERLAENAERISDAGKELHKRICDFVNAYVNVGKSLDKAKSEYDAGMTRLESRVLVQARRLEKLGAKSAKSLPEGLAAQPDIEPEAEA